MARLLKPQSKKKLYEGWKEEGSIGRAAKHMLVSVPSQSGKAAFLGFKPFKVGGVSRIVRLASGRLNCMD